MIKRGQKLIQSSSLNNLFDTLRWEIRGLRKFLSTRNFEILSYTYESKDTYQKIETTEYLQQYDFWDMGSFQNGQNEFICLYLREKVWYNSAARGKHSIQPLKKGKCFSLTDLAPIFFNPQLRSGILMLPDDIILRMSHRLIHVLVSEYSMQGREDYMFVKYNHPYCIELAGGVSEYTEPCYVYLTRDELLDEEYWTFQYILTFAYNYQGEEYVSYIIEMEGNSKKAIQLMNDLLHRSFPIIQTHDFDKSDMYYHLLQLSKEIGFEILI